MSLSKTAKIGREVRKLGRAEERSGCRIQFFSYPIFLASALPIFAGLISSDERKEIAGMLPVNSRQDRSDGEGH